jgi:hypothetical protein
MALGEGRLLTDQRGKRSRQSTQNSPTAMSRIHLSSLTAKNKGTAKWGSERLKLAKPMAASEELHCGREMAT